MMDKRERTKKILGDVQAKAQYIEEHLWRIEDERLSYTFNKLFSVSMMLGELESIIKGVR